LSLNAWEKSLASLSLLTWQKIQRRGNEAKWEPRLQNQQRPKPNPNLKTRLNFLKKSGPVPVFLPFGIDPQVRFWF
jgi:hypothetical protein